MMHVRLQKATDCYFLPSAPVKKKMSSIDQFFCFVYFVCLFFQFFFPAKENDAGQTNKKRIQVIKQEMKWVENSSRTNRHIEKRKAK